MWNPRIGKAFDIKMFLYLIGAVVLQCNLLSAVLLQQRTQGQVSNAMLLYTALFSWFVAEYMASKDK